MNEQITVTIEDVQDAEPAHLTACIELVKRQNPRTATIYINKRKADGWLEYLVSMKYRNGGGMLIGVIQRTPDSEIECHS